MHSTVPLNGVSKNPCDAVNPPRYQRPELRIINEEGILVLLEAARETPYYALFYLALFTGMRRSELLALRWPDADLLSCMLPVPFTILGIVVLSPEYQRQPGDSA